MSHLIWLAWIYQLTVKLITEIKTIWVRVAPTKQKVKGTCSQVCALNVMYTFLSPISTQSPLLQVNWSSEQVVKDIIVFPKSPKQKKSLWISHSWGPESKIWLCSTVSTNIYTHKQILENGCTGCIHPGVVGHPHGPQLLLWVIGDYGVLLSLEHDVACLIIHNLAIRP